MRNFKSIVGGLGLLATQIQFVHSHAIINSVVGANGVKGSAFGLRNDVPRDGTDEQPFQIDTPILKNLVERPCGETLRDGSINVKQSLAKAEQRGLPSLTNDMKVTMQLHQINGDGGGPFTAMFNTDGTGRKWQAAKVTLQALGADGLLVGGPFESKFQAQLPQGTKCTGGRNGNACLVRISNGGSANGAGPFGGCVAVQMPNGGGGNGNRNNNRNKKRNNNNRQGGKGNNDRNRQSNDDGNRSGGRGGDRGNDGDDDRKNDGENRIDGNPFGSSSFKNDILTGLGSAVKVGLDTLLAQNDNGRNGGEANVKGKPVLTKQQEKVLEDRIKADMTRVIEAFAALSTQDPSKDRSFIKQTNEGNPDRAVSKNLQASAALQDGRLKSFSKAPQATAAPQNPGKGRAAGGKKDKNGRNGKNQQQGQGGRKQRRMLRFKRDVVIS